MLHNFCWSHAFYNEKKIFFREIQGSQSEDEDDDYEDAEDDHEVVVIGGDNAAGQESPTKKMKRKG